MKPLNEGFRAYSSHAPKRELRPPKLSLPRSAPPREDATDRPLPAWVIWSALAALAVFVLFLALST